MANTSINRAFSSSSVDTKATWSFWVKRSKIGAEQWIFQSRDAASNNYRTYIRFSGADLLDMRLYNTSASLIGRLQTNRAFKDTSGWYHIVWQLDTTDNTPANRFKLYVNGVQETSFAETTNFTHNLDFRTVSSVTTCWGRNAPGNSEFLDACLSHIHFIDGTAYDATAFGSTDSTTGEWKIKTSPSVTYGTNGYFILKDGISVTDSSTNSNAFSVAGGTLTKTEDCPSNVFATMNPLNVPASNPPTFANGNTTVTSSTSGSSKFGGNTTLGMVTGKYYCEAKATVDGSYSRNVVGVTGDAQNTARNSGSILGSDQASSGYYSADGTVKYNASTAYTGSSYVTGDIIQVAIDLDNNKLYYGKNGTWQNSGVPTSGSTGTGAISIAAGSATNDGAYFFAQSDDTGTSSPSKFEFNFGNGYFGTTAVSSAGTNASGLGIFEYDVPAGYTALCTKGLNL